MNIHDGFRSLDQVFGNGAANPVAHKSARAFAAVQGQEGFRADEAHVSPAASLATQAATAPDVRMEKVSTIQQALATGNYKISNFDVAASLVDQMLQR